jgi:hypothetical protein
MTRFGRRLWLPLLAGALFAMPAAAGPYIWDQDEDGLDDRMETVHLLGYEFSFADNDTLQPQRFEVTRVGGGLVFGLYVVYLAAPTATDLAALTLLGLPVHHRLASVPVVRSTGTFAQASLARQLAGVERIEVIPLLYPGLVEGAATAAVRDATGRVFPAWDTDPAAADGHGVVVAVLDTGINDSPEGGYPGHESLAGRCLGGAVYTAGDSLLDTPKAGSTNPEDHGGATTRAHGTHVAGIVLGTGGASGHARGIAPGARYVDVKVLNDAGVGTAVAEAIDWCTANRTRDWGDPDPAFRGIDVINLSLSSLDASDGNDVASRAAARAAQAGIVVVASMGNEGEDGIVPSPAAGDGVIAVGAWDAQRTARPDDDLWPAFNNTGPRAGDGDPDPLDELKPEVLAPGVAILSGDGDLGSDGAQYRRASGTSAASAFVAGAAALLLAEEPALLPGDVERLLTTTARRDLPAAPAGTGGPDPRWRSTRGFGLIDVQAARLELLAPGTSQVTGLALVAAESTLTARLSTQRERGAAHFAVERAPDEGGVPGAFAAFDSAAAGGDSSLAGAANRSVYAFDHPVPPAERGMTFWYRTAFTEGGVRHAGPPLRFASPVGPRAATLEVTIIHNAYDHDLDATVEAAGGVNGPPSVLPFALPGSGGAVATDWVSGVSATGNVALTFRLGIPHGAADLYLPPSPSTPWTLRVTEGGYLNRSGRVASFTLVHHTPQGDVSYEGVPAMAPTFEGQGTNVQIPAAVTGVGPSLASHRLRVHPSPAPRGGVVTFSAGAEGPARVDVVDLAGRRVGRVELVSHGTERREGRWTAVRADGSTLPSGIYFLHVPGTAGAPAGRLVLLPR